MEAGAGLVAGSHDRNELFVICGHEEPKALKSLDGQVCEICGDEVGLTADGDLFVACDECGFPVCRPCYEYERREGNQLCPQCKTRYKRLKGCLRVQGDEDEEDIDDIEHEFKVERTDDWKMQQGNLGQEPDDAADMDTAVIDEARQPLSRKVPIASGKISPYRMAIAARLIILATFIHYRVMNPVHDAIGLWLTSVICEIWFATSWIFDQFPKWFPIERETYLDRLSLRYEREGEPSSLSPVDVFISAVDPVKEPLLRTANTILSILAVDYPVDKVSCYVSDDGASMLTFESLSEIAEFARKWVPFCKKFSIEPRAPEPYFSLKVDYLKDKVQPAFVKERRTMKREYEEFKVRINALVAKAAEVPPEGWIMQNGTPWPGNNAKDHPGMIRVFLGHGQDLDAEGNELPRLVYISREKKPGFQHHEKAGAMNALIRVSGVLTNAPFLLDLDCDHYVNDSKAIREAMCFMMDPLVGRKVCYVQFPHRFDGADRHDHYADRNAVFFDIDMKGLDGIQGPVYVGTGCVFRRRALYGNSPPKGPKRPKMVSCDCCPCFGPRKKLPMNLKHGENGDAAILQGKDDEKDTLMSQMSLEKKFGQSAIFVMSTLMERGCVPPSSSPDALLKEAIRVISCGYEDKTEWGAELGWMYGSITEDILTGFRMHCQGWRSIYCMPKRAAFKGSAPINLSERLNQVMRLALGSVEIFLGRHSPLWYGYKEGKLKWLERFAYINTTIYPFTSLPLATYCTLPAICLLTDKFIIPPISTFSGFLFIALVISIFVTGILEMRWSGASIEEWWRNEQFWVIGGISAHLCAVVQGLLKMLAGIDTSVTFASKVSDDEEFRGLYTFKRMALLILPTTILMINLVGVVAGVSDAINNGYQAMGPLFGKLLFSSWVLVPLYPFLKGLMGKQNRTPTIIVIWSVLLASVFSLVWVRIDPFVLTSKGPDTKQCGIDC